MFALWNLSFDLFFLYDVGGWAKVGEGRMILGVDVALGMSQMRV